MKKVLIVVALLAAGFVSPHQADAGARTESNRWKECRMNEGGPAWKKHEVKQEIRCATWHWHVSGGNNKAFSVASCESGFNEHSDNPRSSAGGVFQFLASTWNHIKQAHHELRRRWNLAKSRYNARANVVHAIRMASNQGWGAWSCA